MIKFEDAQLTDILPHSLSDDPKVKALSLALLDINRLLLDYIKQTGVYSDINDLQEDVLDLLAQEWRTQYYDDNFDIEAKRRLIEGTISWYMMAGTPAAVERVVKAVFGGAEIQEWFEYGGEPGYFQIICYITDENIDLNIEQIIRAVMTHKRLAAHLESVIFQANCRCEFQTRLEFYHYTTPLTGRLNAGTHPYRNTKGDLNDVNIIIQDGMTPFWIHARQAGTVPYRNRVFSGNVSEIDIPAAATITPYKSAASGKVKAGEIPQRNTVGQETRETTEFDTALNANRYTSDAAGTTPYRNTIGDGVPVQIDAKAASMFSGHKAGAAGRQKAGEKPQRAQESILDGANVEAQAGYRDYGYKTSAAGKLNTGESPYRDTSACFAGAGVQAKSEVVTFSHTAAATGQKNAGESPQREKLGLAGSGPVEIQSAADETVYLYPITGTSPDRSSIYRDDGGNIGGTTSATTYAYRTKICGRKIL